MYRLKEFIYIPIVAAFLAACSDNGGFDAVTDHIPQGEEQAQETMEPVVQVHSVAGSTDGTVFKVEDRSKWIVTEASVFREHPKALIITSEGQQLEGMLVAFDIERNEAIVHIRNSAVVEAEQMTNQVQLEEMLLTEQLTAAERYTLKSAFTETDVPQKYDSAVLANYESETFDFNPDELQVFVEHFNDEYNQYVATGDMTAVKELLLSDLLIAAFEKAENKRYVQNFQGTAVTKAGFEWVVKGTSDDFDLTYKINRVDGQYYITYFMIEQ